MPSIRQIYPRTSRTCFIRTVSFLAIAYLFIVVFVIWSMINGYRRIVTRLTKDTLEKRESGLKRLCKIHLINIEREEGGIKDEKKVGSSARPEKDSWV